MSLPKKLLSAVLACAMAGIPVFSAPAASADAGFALSSRIIEFYNSIKAAESKVSAISADPSGESAPFDVFGIYNAYNGIVTTARTPLYMPGGESTTTAASTVSTVPGTTATKAASTTKAAVKTTTAAPLTTSVTTAFVLTTAKATTTEALTTTTESTTTTEPATTTETTTTTTTSTTTTTTATTTETTTTTVITTAGPVPPKYLNTVGIDVSRWNGDIDWKKVKASGIDFAIIQAGYGRELYQEDPKFDTNVIQAQAAGVDVGVYWYSYARDVEGAYLEAQCCYEIIKEHNYNYPIYYDIEEPWLQSNLSPATVSAMIETFCSYLEARGCYVGVYSYASFLSSMVYTTTLNKYAVWVAHYGVSKPAFSGSYGMWQYASTGSVNGINGNVDMNYGYINYPSIISPETYKGPVVYPDNPTVLLPNTTVTTTTTTTTTIPDVMPWGVYVSDSYGTQVNWEMVRAEEASFAAVSVGTGGDEIVLDKNFAANVEGAHAAGLGAAAVWHARSLTPEAMAKESEIFESIISKYSLEYPVCLDLSDPAFAEAGLSAEEYTELITAFCAPLEQKRYFVSIKGDHDFLTTKLDPDLFVRYDAWVTSYVEDLSLIHI